MYTKSKKFVYHYPSVNKPKQGITTVDVPAPIYKHTPVKIHRRMDNIAENIRKFNPNMYIHPVQKEKECPHCGSKF